MKTLCILSLAFMMVYSAHISTTHHNLKDIRNQVEKIQKNHTLLDKYIYMSKDGTHCVEKFFCLAAESLTTFPKHSHSLQESNELKRLRENLRIFNEKVTKCNCEPYHHSAPKRHLRILLDGIISCTKADIGHMKCHQPH